MREVEFLDELNFLLTESARYKVLYGGRGAGKSEGIVIALIIWATRKRLRIACFREFQNSISESVYSLLKSKIHILGLEDEFDIQKTTIISKRTGSEFIFFGLKYNIDTIKSMAAIDIAWIEEANNVSKSSWDKLTPTIRGRHKDDPNGNIGPFNNGPEIWISFNPELDTDETYKRFVLNPPAKLDSHGNQYAIIKKINHSQNKWFPDDLREEMEQLKAKDENRWLEVWEGHTKQVLDGAIYESEIKQLLKDGRLGKVPYDPDKPVHTFWDLGHSDQTAIWFIQTVGLEYNVINYYQDNLKKIGFYLEYMQSLQYVYGTDYLPHDADNETLASRSVNKLMIAAGRKTRLVQRPAKKFLGINAARTVFPLCNFDENNTQDGMQCLRRFCYAVDEETGQFSKEPKHDQYSHGADAFQTFALSLKSEMASKKPIRTVASGHKYTGANRGNAWMA